MKEQELYRDEARKDEEFDLKRWIFRIFQSWYWFAGSIFICVLAAWLYLRYTNPVYSATASVMIKDEKKGGDIPDNSVLKELGIGSSKLVENEIEVFRSYDLMEEVVRRQQLYISFSGEGRIRDIPFFGHEVPFELKILSPDSIVVPLRWVINLNKGQNTVTSGTNKLPISYGNINKLDGVRFQIMPRERNITDGTQPPAGTYFADIVSIRNSTTEFNSKLSVNAVSKQASVVALSINDTHRERARIVIATLIEIYNRQGLDDKNKVTANTIDFLNERLKAVTADLQGVEGQVQQFKSLHNVTDISADAQQFMEMSRDIDAQRAESQTRMNIVSALENELLLHQDSASLMPSTLGLNEVSLASLIEKHNSLVLEKERVLKDVEFRPMNPLIINLQQQVLETRSKLLQNVRSLKEAYQIALNDISRKDEQLRARIGSMPQLERKLVEIKRNQNVEEQLYAFLLQKREEAAVTLASNIPDSRTIIRSRDLGQVSPKSKLIWAFALIIGFAVPFVIMIISDFLNNKVGDATEVEKKSRVPLLGIISHIRKIKSSIVISEHSRSVVAEQIRTLRTAIGFTGKGKEVKKILITSSQPGDGKSFISINLAASYALLKKKTVLVELDLRKPHVAKYLGLPGKTGVSNILVGKAKVEDALLEVPNFDQQLFLLPSGYLPPNPAELISGTKMLELIEELEKRFDYIIIDTPPFGLVTDAVLLQRYADITLAVLRQGYTHKDVYQNLDQRVQQKPEYPLYAVLNGVGWRKRYQQRYGYGKYGEYSYGKGYFTEDDK